MGNFDEFVKKWMKNGSKSEDLRKFINEAQGDEWDMQRCLEAIIELNAPLAGKVLATV